MTGRKRRGTHGKSDKPEKHGPSKNVRNHQGTLPPEARTWPLVRAYAPVADVWQATGLGTAAVVRRRPDNHCVSSFFTIHLLDHGLQMVFGKSGTTLEETDHIIASLRDEIPPMEESSIEQAALYAWGAFALSELDGCSFPPDVLERFLPIVPRPAGSMIELRDALLGPGGPTPSALMEVIAANPMTDDTPEGREVVIFTEMTFDLSDPTSAVSRLQRAGPGFQQEDSHRFCWTRAYPEGPWSPLARLGGRQILGSVRVDGDALIAESKTLSMAARLAAILKDMFGDTIRLRGTRWRGAQDMLRERTS